MRINAVTLPLLSESFGLEKNKWNTEEALKRNCRRDKSMKRLWCLFVLLALFFRSGSASALEVKDGEGMLQNNPYVTLKVDIEGTRFFDIRLNGVVVYRDTNAGLPIKREIPVNKWMLAGENDLEMTLVYLDDDPAGEKVEASAALQVRQHGQQPDASVSIATLSFKGRQKTADSSPEGRFTSHPVFAPSEQGDVVVSAVSAQYIPATLETVPAAIINRTVDLPLNLPQWGFAQSDLVLDKDLDDMNTEEANAAFNALVKEIYPIYKKIHDAVKTGNVDEILPLFEERNRELESALFLPPGEARKELAAFFKESADDPGKALVDMIEPRHAYLDVSPNGRMVQMVRDGFNKPIIVFRRSDLSIEIQLDIVLRKSGDQWIVTR